MRPRAGFRDVPQLDDAGDLTDAAFRPILDAHTRGLAHHGPQPLRNRKRFALAA
jgi:hypothetical protein